MKHCMSFAKGMGLGLVVGVAAATAFKCACHSNRKFRRNTSKAARAVSEIMDDLQALIN